MKFRFGFKKRKLINKNEEKVSWLQIIGFFLILAGLGYLVFVMFFYDNVTAVEVASIFFDVMLGVAFAFPDMLKDETKQVSTMRIVVFMFVNVICMLLLKIGWDKESFDQIGIDGYWMGIIGFLFGAKAAQSYFESKLAVTQRRRDNADIPGVDVDAEPAYESGNAQLAISANKDKLSKEFPQIKKFISSFYSDGKTRVPCVDICISGTAKQNIPAYLEYRDTDGSIRKVKTRVIPNYGNAKPQIRRGDFISNHNTRLFPGTVCCALESDDPDKRYLLTCNHVMTGGKFENPGKTGAKAVRFIFGDVFDDVGKWILGRMDDKIDAAIIDIDKTERVFSNDINPEIYIVSEDDCSQTEVEFKGALSKTKRAFIIHIDQPIDVDYKNETVEMNGLITLSSDLNHFNFSAPTQKGDSGSLVYHANTRQPIGMVIGANSQFSFVVPIQALLEAFPDLQLRIPNS